MSTYTRNQNHRVFDFFNCMEEKDCYWFPRPDFYIFQGQDYLHCCRVDKNFPGRQSKLCRISAKHMRVPRCFRDMNWVYSCRFFFKERSSYPSSGILHILQWRIQTFRKGEGGWSKKKLFLALWASVWSKNKGGGQAPRAPPLDLPLFLLQFRVSESAIACSHKSVRSSALF